MQNAETLALLGQIKILKAELVKAELEKARMEADLRAQLAAVSRELAEAREVIKNGGVIG